MADNATDTTDALKGLIAWFARNHVAANLLMCLIVIAGLYAAFTMRTQVTPDLRPNDITIQIPYPGASPGEVELGAVLRVEEAVRDIEGIEEMSSNSREGSGSVRLEIENGYDLKVVADEVKLAVDRIASLPADAERPIITRSFKQFDAIQVQVYGDLDERGLKALAMEVRDEILNLPSVTSVALNGARPYEISIEVTEAALRQYGLTLAEVSQAIRASSVDLGAGSIRTQGGNILLRTQGQAYSERDFESIVLRTRADGTRVTLGDVAKVTDGFAEQDFFSLFNGKPTVGIAVSAVGDQNQIDISEEVKDYVAERQRSLPAGIHLEHWMDSTEFLSSTLNMMLTNMMMGAVLVLLILSLFLRIQLAFWVMLGIPIAFLGAFALLPVVGGSINMISLFGFILVLGIVVDDAIVIGESVQTSLERDGHGVDNVIRGARRVAIPATFGVLTTIATFTPLLFVPGSFGAIPMAIGWVVILCLGFSIIESKLILPAHLASMKPLPSFDPEHGHPIRRFQNWFASRLRKFIYERYEPLLHRAIANRYITASIFVGMLIVAVGFTLGPYVQTQMFGSMSMDFVRARVELPEGASSDQTVKVVREVADKLVELNDSMDEDDRFLQSYMAFTNNAEGSIMADLKADDDLDASEVGRLWRERIGEIAGTRKLEISGMQRSHGGDTDLTFRLVGGNINEIKAAAGALALVLREYDGVYEISNSAEGAIPEMNIRIKPSGEALGLTLRDLASQVRYAFYGVESQRIQRRGEEVRVMVRYPEHERQSLGNLESMYIRTPTGRQVPFSAVAVIEHRLSPSAIRRVNGDRTVEVSANMELSGASAGDIVRDVRTNFGRTLAEHYPSVRLEMGGALEQERELMLRLLFTATLGLLAVYALMAIPLKSYSQPLIIMGVIPFGMIGALVGHLIVGIPFSAMSMFGLVALAGVVVNDSLIMVDFVNKSVASGMPLREAVVKAGTDRFRAILLTSLTTFFGLVPILLETSFTSEMVTPMAVSLSFGIVFATLITLVLVPSLYVILDDFKSRKTNRASARLEAAAS